MDPVTGLSRRQQIALGLLIPVGVLASTLATIIGERGDPACPDEVYECATFEAHEPVVIGLVNATEDRLPLEAVAEPGETVGGRILRYEAHAPGCDVEAAAEAIRELASDPPDEPPAALVVAAGCDAAAVPMAQMLSDSGITLITLGRPPSSPTDPGYHLVAPELDLQTDAAGLQDVGLVSHVDELVEHHLRGVLERVIQVADRLAVRSGDELLIPRTQLRDALIEAGFERA